MGFRDDIYKEREAKKKTSSFREQIITAQKAKKTEPPKTVTLTFGKEKVEVPQPVVAAMTQEIRNRQPFVLMENNLRAQKAQNKAVEEYREKLLSMEVPQAEKELTELKQSRRWGPPSEEEKNTYERKQKEIDIAKALQTERRAKYWLEEADERDLPRLMLKEDRPWESATSGLYTGKHMSLGKDKFEAKNTDRLLNRLDIVAPMVYPEFTETQKSIRDARQSLDALPDYDDEDYWTQRKRERTEEILNREDFVPYLNPDLTVNEEESRSEATNLAIREIEAEREDNKSQRAGYRKNIMDLESMEKVYKYSAVTRASDFEEYAKKGAEMVGTRAPMNKMFGAGLDSALATEHEAKIYNYLFAKYGENVAEDYYDGLNVILTQRQGKNDAEWIDNINVPVIEQLVTAGHGLDAGLSGWVQGIGELFSDKPHKTTRKEAASQYILEDLADDGIVIGDQSVGQYLYKGTQTVGNMLPSIAISYATSGVASGLGASSATASAAGAWAGNIALGASAAGSAKAQALAEGYDIGQATTYGVLVGASEMILQEILGGVSKLGGINETRLMAKLQAVDNAFLRVSGTTGLKLVGEITEEELQLFLEPYFRTVVFNEEYDAPEVGEIIETALVTALSTGGLESGATISTAKGNGKLGAEIISGNYTDDVIAKGLSSPLGSVERELAQSLQTAKENGEEVSAHKLGTLANMIEYEVQSSDEQTSPATEDEAPMEADDGIVHSGEKVNVTPGFTKNEYSYDVSNKTIRALDAIGKKLGVEIEIGAPTGNSYDAYNGKYENGKITIARDAENPLEVVLSHEVTHHMQKVAPTEYAKFVELAVNASTKLSDMDKSSIIERYRTEYADATRTEFSDQAAIDEITADYAGKLVRDVSLFRGLLNADRNVAQRFVDGVKRFISSVKSTFSKDKKKADTASLEKYGLTVKELEKAINAYEGMIKNTREAVESGLVGADRTSSDAEIFGSVEGETENTAGTDAGGVKYDLKKVNGKTVAWIESNPLTNKQIENPEEVAKYVAQNINDIYAIIEDGVKVYIGEDLPNEYTMSKYSQAIRSEKSGKWKAKVKAAAGLDLLIEAATGRKWEKTEHPQNKDAKYGMYRYNSTFAFPIKDREGNVTNIRAYDVELLIRNASDGKKYLYDIVRIKEDIPSAKSLKQKEASRATYEAAQRGNIFNNSIHDSSGKNNPQFSLKKNTDNQGRELSAEQAEYFKDSKARDSEGNLLVMYRGGNEDFTVFDRKKSKYSNLYGRGFYFTDSESHAGQYGKVREYYLNIKNPVSTTEKTITREQVRAFLEAVAGNEDDYSFENYGYGATVDSVLDSVSGGKSDFNIIYDVSQTAIGDMVEAVELFNEINGTMFDGLILDTETVTFNSNQAKSVNNKTPTGNPDINMSLKRGDMLSKDYKSRVGAGDGTEPSPAREEAPVVVSKTESAAPKTVTETRAVATDKEMTRADELVAEANEREAEARGYKDSYLEETGFLDYANDQEDKALQDKAKGIDKENLNKYYGELEKQAQIFADEQAGGEDKRIEEANEMLLTGAGPKRASRREQLEQSANWFNRKFIDSAATVRKIGKKANDEHLYAIYNQARNGTNIAAHMIKNAQTDARGRRVGDSLVDIIAPIKEKGEDYWRDFQLYLLHKHNVARMSIYNPQEAKKAKEQLTRYINEHPEIGAMSKRDIDRYYKDNDKRGMAVKMYVELKKAADKAAEKNKAIFYDKAGTHLDAARSNRAATELLKKNPDFAEHEKAIRKYIDNLMDYRVASGLITQDEADYFRKKYPDYVPTYRNTDSAWKQMSGNITIGTVIGKAKGGNDDILPLDIALAEMTKKVVRNGQKNIFANKLLDIDGKSYDAEKYIKKRSDEDYDFEGEIDSIVEDKAISNVVSFYRDGKRVELIVTPDLYEAFEMLSPEVQEKTGLTQTAKKINDGYKKLITTYDPTFALRNAIKDLQDGIFNSRDAKGFLKNYLKAYKEIATNGEMWQLYQSVGGLYSSRFEDIAEKGIGGKEGKLRKTMDAVAFANLIVEQAPRLAEFMAVIEKGDIENTNTLADALLASAEVTTNFGASGTITRELNKYVIPFLNPGVQGAAQFWRTATRSRTAKQWIGFAVKCAWLGIGTGLANDLLMAIFGDDEAKEDYENLTDRDKDNYFLCPIGDGNFLKLPKGRVNAVLGTVTDRARDIAKGEDVDFGDVASRFAEHLLPENPLDSHILKGIMDSELFDKESKGRTWYGADIESDRMQSLPVAERYDSSTDELSKWIGKTFNVSPKKVNYILKQYTGGVGRMVLPMLTPSEQKGDNVGETIVGGIGSIFTSNFIKDSKLSNKVSGEFYDAVTRAEQSKNSSKGTDVDKVVYKYLNRARNNLGEYNTKIRNAESDENLTASGRRAAVRVATAERTAYQKSILENVDKYRESVEKHLDEYPGADGDKRMEYAYNKANYEVYGPEYAIRADGSSTYKKYEEKVRRGKMSWEEAYDDCFGKSDRKYTALKDRFDISYDEFEKIAEAMSKNSTEEEEIEALHKLGYRRSTARVIRRKFNKVK